MLSLHACNCCTVLQPSVKDFPLLEAPHAMTAHPCLWHDKQPVCFVKNVGIVVHPQETWGRGGAREDVLPQCCAVHC